MADVKLYLRPIGFLYGDMAAKTVAEGVALPLTGGAIAFTAAELIEGTPRAAKRRLVTAQDLARSRDADLDLVLKRVTAPRPPFAGFAFTRPLIMGIVNVTPDSFSDGGLYDTTEGAIVHAAELAKDGAEIVDVGGESTRPGSDAVEEGEELSRVIPVLEGLAGLRAAVSIDTRKASVARAAAKVGVKIFNDVSAMTYDQDSLAAAAETGLSVILMHAKGEPKTMQTTPAMTTWRSRSTTIWPCASKQPKRQASIAPASPPTPVSASARPSPTPSRCLPISAYCMGLACRCSSGPRASASSAGWRAAKHRSRGRPDPSPLPLSRRRKAHKS